MRYILVAGLCKQLTDLNITSPEVQICLLGCTALIALMMEAARTSETSVDNYFTRQYIPEDNSELHTRRRENLKSHSSP
jgi:hypothetical protein